MKIILLERVPNLGIMGDTVTVKPGYARNYLLPLKKAMRATKANLEAFAGQRQQLEAQNLVRRKEAEAVAERMADVMVTLIRSASETGHLYGSVRSLDIAEALKGAGYSVARTQVQLGAPIKMLGENRARVILHPEVSIEVGVLVSRSQEEASVALNALKKSKEKAAASTESQTASEAIVAELS